MIIKYNITVRNMPYKTGGAPRNPFEAAKLRNVCFGQGETEPKSNIDFSTTTNTHQHRPVPMATPSNQPMCESEKEMKASCLADKLPSPTEDNPELCELSADPWA